MLARSPRSWIHALLRARPVLLAALLFAPSPIAAGEPIRAAYFYGYMDPEHLDALAAAGFNRAVVKCLGDSLDDRRWDELRGFVGRGPGVGIEVVPEWSLQSPERLAALPTTRRYTWGSGTVERGVGCPVDSVFWRSMMRDRVDEILEAFPSVRRVAIDLEIYGASRHHYDEPCRCARCQKAFAARRDHEPADLEGFEEERLTRILVGLLDGIRLAHPRVELGFFDLDYDAFVHRAVVRALAAAGTRTCNYTERTYSTGAQGIPRARFAVAALRLSAPLVCGLKLRSFTPARLSPAIHSVLAEAEGYFIFTSYSLWQRDTTRLTGAYALAGDVDEYWSALRKANRARSRTRQVSDWREVVLASDPASRGATVRLTLSDASHVTLGIHDLQGRRIWAETREHPAGEARMSWVGVDRAGNAAPAGVYFACVEAGGRRAVRRFFLSR